MSRTITGMWFRKDLRLVDNTALIALMKERNVNESVIGIFNINPLQLKKELLTIKPFLQQLKSLVKKQKKQDCPFTLLWGNLKKHLKH